MMNWIYINFYTENSPEIMGVSEMDMITKKKKTDWLGLFFKSLSVITYVPTGFQLLKYLVHKEK